MDYKGLGFRVLQECGLVSNRAIYPCFLLSPLNCPWDVHEPSAVAGDHKVAAIGVRVCKWFTYHGLALNVSTDLAPFKNIVPCGIADRPVGSIFQILAGRELSPDANHGPLSEHVDATTLLALVHVYLLQSFSEVFDVELVSPANLFHHPNRRYSR